MSLTHDHYWKYDYNPNLPVEFSLDQCIKCNICTTVCPVSAVTDLFPGPKYEAPQAGRFRHPGQATPDKSVDYCSGCRACNMACPTGVKIAEMNARARATIVQQGEGANTAPSEEQSGCPTGIIRNICASGCTSSKCTALFCTCQVCHRKGAEYFPPRATPVIQLQPLHHLV